MAQVVQHLLSKQEEKKKEKKISMTFFSFAETDKISIISIGNFKDL
jgi:hypothetical protein